VRRVGVYGPATGTRLLGLRVDDVKAEMTLEWVEVTVAVE
jgi:hypothetical protein